MLKTLKLVTIAVAAALALPAFAGPSWPPTPPRKDSGKVPAIVKIVKAPETRVVNGFEYVGGESGWQLAQHKYDFVNGKLVMSDECDHVIRTVRAPTPAEVEQARQFSPG